MVPKLGCSKSRCLAMVVAQGSTKALTTFDWPDGGTLQYLGRDQSIAETLVISLTVVVLNILGDDLAQVPFTERDHLAQTLLPDRAHEALSERIEVRASSRQPQRAHATCFEYLRKSAREQRVAVVNQIARAAQKAVARIGEAARNLLGQLAVNLVCDPSNVHTPTFQVDDEEHEIPNETGARHDFDGEEVCRRDCAPVGFQECLPTRPLAPLRRGLEARIDQDPLDRIAPDIVPDSKALHESACTASLDFRKPSLTRTWQALLLCTGAPNRDGASHRTSRRRASDTSATECLA